ncbi:MAG TPA: hypothetical protein VM143_12745 [Acidimicrobiales bacterium]|nr:hypothetical protein [Acidimicrobiales bacterium]
MPIGVRLQPGHLTAPAGADIDGTIVVSNPGAAPVHVRIVIASEVAGWASIEPGDVWVAPGEDREVDLRFRLPRGAPGGVGDIPFTIRVLSDHEGEGGATVTGSLDVTGEAELALRLLPGTFRGTLTGSTRVAVDNLGSTPARAQLILEAPATADVEADPDSLIVEPNSTAFARVHVRPHRRHLSGAPLSHEFWVRMEPMGGARISASGTMFQRSMVAGLLSKVLAGVVAVALVLLLMTRILGDDGTDTKLASSATTVPITTATTTPLATTALPEVTGQVTAAPTTIPVKQRRIAFQTKRDGNYEIYTVDADGRNPKNLTMHPGHDGEPAWSPDHTRLAFDSDRNGGFDIYIMNADGSGLAQVTTEPAPDGYPTWSPDGTQLAFTSFRDGNSEIYVMGADGTGARRLTKNLADDSRPVWSPDGSRIAFHSDRDGNYEIYVMKADGTEQRNLSNSPASDKNPSWSPNNARLTFDSTRDGPKAELYVMGADGSLPVRLTTNDWIDAWPVWSPDGARLLFQMDQASDLELHTMSAGGGPSRRLTESPGEDAEPAWG